MAIKKRKLEHDQGTSFGFYFKLVKTDNVTPWDNLEGAEIVGRVCAVASSLTSLVEFDSSLDPLTGEASVTFSAETSSAIPVKPSLSAQRVLTTYTYDIELHYADGKEIRLFDGDFIINPEAKKSS